MFYYPTFALCVIQYFFVYKEANRMRLNVVLFDFTI